MCSWKLRPAGGPQIHLLGKCNLSRVATRKVPRYGLDDGEVTCCSHSNAKQPFCWIIDLNQLIRTVAPNLTPRPVVRIGLQAYSSESSPVAKSKFSKTA
jgi:hypothetical protein